jgi:plasmid stabilization system protein ParE
MLDKVSKVAWTRQARESLKAILDYRYKNIPSARKIVRKDIIDASKQIVFSKQYQKDEIFPEYRRIVVRDYKVLYKEIKGVVYILNVVCTKASTDTITKTS